MDVLLAALNASRFLRVAIPVLLTVDMVRCRNRGTVQWSSFVFHEAVTNRFRAQVHNVIIISRLARARLKVRDPRSHADTPPTPA